MDARAFHLPDLPNAGYATLREKQLSDAIMTFMREVERDRIRLLSIVIDGIDKWRKICLAGWRGFQMAPDLADEMFHYFELQVVSPRVAAELLLVAKNPQKWRDLMKDAMPGIEAQRNTMKLTEKWSPYAQ